VWFATAVLLLTAAVAWLLPGIQWLGLLLPLAAAVVFAAGIGGPGARARGTLPPRVLLIAHPALLLLSSAYPLWGGAFAPELEHVAIGVATAVGVAGAIVGARRTGLPRGWRLAPLWVVLSWGLGLSLLLTYFTLEGPQQSELVSLVGVAAGLLLVAGTAIPGTLLLALAIRVNPVHARGAVPDSAPASERTHRLPRLAAWTLATLATLGLLAAAGTGAALWADQARLSVPLAARMSTVPDLSPVEATAALCSEWGCVEGWRTDVGVFLRFSQEEEAAYVANVLGPSALRIGDGVRDGNVLRDLTGITDPAARATALALLRTG
jgi:hypothetical protein